MKNFTRYVSLGIVTALALYGCNIGGATSTPSPSEAIFGPASGDAASVSLTVVAVNGATVFNTVGQVINYSYTVTNTGNPALAGPVGVADNKTTLPTCAAVTSVGNANNNLDNDEAVLCTSQYTINQNDLNAGSVVSAALAQVGGIPSNTVNTTVPMAANKSLTLTVTPNVTTYSAAGQVITYSHTIKNTGATPLGPDQFRISDNRTALPISCDVPNRTLGLSESIACSGSYTVTQSDLGAANITSTFTASGGGATSQPVTTVVARGVITGGNYTKGSNISHTVVSGEWLYQIARCYGADITAVLAANPQIPNPHWILPAMTVNVPNIGSKSAIYGPPCVGYYVVQVGDTWDNIKTRFNADVTVLQAANRNASLSNGTCIKIPLNSAGGAATPQTALTSCPAGSGAGPTPDPNQTIRITFPPNTTGTTVTGSIAGTASIRYLLAVAQGQTLNVKVNATANTVTLGITAFNGTLMKAQDANLTFTGTIPSSGDLTINVTGADSSTKQFSIEVSVTNPTSPSLFERVADVNPGINSSDPAYLANFNGQLFFRATGNDNTGAELWKYDLATKTPSRMTDEVPGPTSFDPAFLTSYNGALYFRANGNDGGGVELWRWNGSDAGRLTDINAGAGDANPSYLAVFNGFLYFSAKGSDNAGVELWRTDGINQPTRVADINTGPGDSNPAYLTVFGNALYFSAVSTDGAGVELWKYDGANPPTRISDINAGVGNSNPAHMAVFNNALYFSAIGNDNMGIEIWRYDGVNAPSRVTDINPGAGDSAPSFLTVFNNALYFSAISNDGKGIELWKYDGSSAKLVGDLNTVGNSSPSYLLVFNNELYFQANGNDGAGAELWKFKGP
jgi:ELWxxDGT repeat protein